MVSTQVRGVGTLLVPNAMVDVADAVEPFAAAADAAGHSEFRDAEMRTAYALLGRERACGRPLAAPVTIEGVFEDGREVTVAAYEDPFLALAAPARGVVRAGAAVRRDWFARLYGELCALRPCGNFPLPPPLTLPVPPLGVVTVEPWDEPADAVELFARSAFATGHDVAGSSVEEMLGWYCRRRRCVRQALARDVAVDVPLAGGDLRARATCAYWEPPEYLSPASTSTSRRTRRRAIRREISGQDVRRSSSRDEHAGLDRNRARTMPIEARSGA